MLIVHHLENSRSQRILWLLEELGVEYEIKRYGRDKQTSLAPPELKEIHPLGKAPVIVDNGVTVAESGAIIEYLVHTYDDDKLHPSEGSAEWRSYTYWMHYAEGTFMPLMIISLILTRIETSPMLFFVKPVAKGIAGKVRASYLDANVKNNLAFLDQTLSESTWFCGDRFTARCANEFCAGSRGGQDRSRRVLPSSCRLSSDRAGETRVQSRARSWWALRVDGRQERLDRGIGWAFYV